MTERAAKLLQIIRKTIQSWYDHHLGLVKVGMLSIEGKQLLNRLKACWREQISVEVAKINLKNEDGITIM